MNVEQIRVIVRERLNPNLFRHSIGVAQAARALAERYGADPDAAYLSGLIHDFGKQYSKDELLQAAVHYQHSLDDLTCRTVKLLHAEVGAVLVEKELGISDPEILNAVVFHTTGRPGMTLLEKIIYLADYIEPGRTHTGLDELRELAFRQLDQALLVAVEQSIKSVLQRGLLLHPRSVEFRNSLLIENEMC